MIRGEGSVKKPKSFTDIHCHMLPGIDDGAESWDESVEMAKMAVGESIETVIVTPHQLGGYGQNTGKKIRLLASQLQQRLNEESIPLRILPGGDVRIEEHMVEGLISGNVMTLGNHQRHVLLELPHELYFPLETILDKLASVGIVGILSHPERNKGLLHKAEPIRGLVRKGCLMQVTAASITGSFGRRCRDFSEWMLQQNLVHCVSTDAHSATSRPPQMREAYERVVELTNRTTADELFCSNPARIARGENVEILQKSISKFRTNRWFSLQQTYQPVA